MKRLTTIEAAYRTDIDEAASRFGDHEGVDEARVLEWLGQFDDDHLAVAAKILGKIRYYGAAAIRALTRQLVLMVRDEHPTEPLNRIVFVPVGPPGGGAMTVARVLRQLNEARGTRILTMADIESVDADQMSIVVLINDFSGTGTELKEWWYMVEPLIASKDAKTVIAVLVMNAGAREELEEITRDVLSVDELGSEENVLAAASTVFAEEERTVLLEYCQRTGCSERYVRGFGECGLLVAFKHFCPNNSLPFLWYDADSWRPIFKRRAI